MSRRKLTDEKLAEIRERAKTLKRGDHKVLAYDMGISPAMLSNIINGRIYSPKAKSP